MLSALDLFLLSLTVLVLFAGLKKRWVAWQKGQPEDRPGNGISLVRYFLANQKILRKKFPGIAHIILFWGFVFNLLIIILSQFRFTLPPLGAHLVSAFADLMGIAMVGSVLFFLKRRIQSPRPGRKREVILPLVILFIILLSGFLAEGSRLALVGADTIWWSPMGWVFSWFSPASPLFMKLIIRFHFYMVLLFIAIIPFTLMRHLIAAPLNVYYKKHTPLEGLKPLPLGQRLPGAVTINDFTWKQLLDVEACTLCGRCEENCPAFIAQKPLSPLTVIQKIFGQMEASTRTGVKPENFSLPPLMSIIREGEIWSCTTCGACNYECPAHLEILEKIIDLRRSQVERKTCPPLSVTALEGMANRGNPWALPPTDRMNWAENLKPSVLKENEEVEWLYWVGCSSSYDPLAQEISHAVLSLLNRSGIRFALLGTKESCCGDPARRIGEEGLFQKICRENIALFHGHRVRKIITQCPHCYNILKNEYPLMGGNYEVYHHSQLFSHLVAAKKLDVVKGLKYSTVFFQDPCYLGRYNQNFNDGRYLIQSIPSLSLLNPGGGDKAFCCGGGGGQMWLEVREGKRVENVRFAQIGTLKPEIIATACPFCKIMLDTARASQPATERQQALPIKDIAELLIEAL
jgi:Fe-S oxidoreductase/nitrate reductase gamma subunit